MALVETILWIALVIILIVILSALPLYLAVNLLGGRTSILKAFFIMIIAGIAYIIIGAILGALLPGFGILVTILAWLVLIGIYKETFGLGWGSAILAWILQLVFIVILAFLIGILFAAIGIGFAVDELMISFFEFF